MVEYLVTYNLSFKAQIKLTIKCFNDPWNRDFDTFSKKMLHLYSRLIFLQVETKCFEDAMKTFKEIKFFKLDSMNPADVTDSIKEYTENGGTICTGKAQGIAFICQLKALTLQARFDFDRCRQWAAPAIGLYIHMGVEMFEGSDEEWTNFLDSSLRFSACFVVRPALFKMLMCHILFRSR